MELILVRFSKNEYAEVVRVRQLVEEVVDAYSQAIQVCSLAVPIDKASLVIKLKLKFYL